MFLVSIMCMSTVSAFSTVDIKNFFKRSVLTSRNPNVSSASNVRLLDVKIVVEKLNSMERFHKDAMNLAYDNNVIKTEVREYLFVVDRTQGMITGYYDCNAPDKRNMCDTIISSNNKDTVGYSYQTTEAKARHAYTMYTSWFINLFRSG